MSQTLCNYLAISLLGNTIHKYLIASKKCLYHFKHIYSLRLDLKTRYGSSLDISSDHTPLVITTTSQVLETARQPTLHTSKTDWELYRDELIKLIDLNISLSSPEELVCALFNFNTRLQKVE